MTDQELFDTVVQALIAQGKPSAILEERGGERNWICQYRSPDGAKCAAGVLLKDEFYKPDFEGVLVRWHDTQHSEERALRAALIASGVTEEQLNLVRSLQWAHDESEHDGQWKSVEKFVETFREAAKLHNLSAAVLDKGLSG